MVGRQGSGHGPAWGGEVAPTTIEFSLNFAERPQDAIAACRLRPHLAAQAAHAAALQGRRCAACGGWAAGQTERGGCGLPCATSTVCAAKAQLAISSRLVRLRTGPLRRGPLRRPAHPSFHCSPVPRPAGKAALLAASNVEVVTLTGNGSLEMLAVGALCARFSCHLSALVAPSHWLGGGLRWGTTLLRQGDGGVLLLPLLLLTHLPHVCACVARCSSHLAAFPCIPAETS